MNVENGLQEAAAYPLSVGDGGTGVEGARSSLEPVKESKAARLSGRDRNDQLQADRGLRRYTRRSGRLPKEARLPRSSALGIGPDVSLEK